MKKIPALFAVSLLSLLLLCSCSLLFSVETAPVPTATAETEAPLSSTETAETTEEAVLPVLRVWATLEAEEKAVDLTGEFAAFGEELDLQGEFDLTEPGEYEATLPLRGEIDEKPLVMKVKLIVLPLPYGKDGKLIDGEYETPKEYTLTVKDGFAYVDGYLIANKTYSLPKDYAPAGLLDEVKTAYSAMRADAPDELRPRLIIDNGYRSWWDQYAIFRGYIARDGQEKAETYSARPGHSEHQSGLAMDIVCAGTAASQQPEKKEVLDWLNENAWQYGFILRYPQDKMGITGYKFEPWHYRFVGKELAEILYNDGDWITMEEYFGFDSVYQAPYNP